eukprot:1078379_1
MLKAHEASQNQKKEEQNAPRTTVLGKRKAMEDGTNSMEEKYALFVIDIVTINGTCVPLEKSFKAVRVVHNQWRRSLGPERLKQLVYCYYNIRAIEKYHGKPFV